MNSKEMLQIIRAKSKKEGQEEHYLLKDHIMDTLERALQIWEFIEKNKNNIDNDFIKSEETFKNLAKSLILHDLGKIDYGFQKKVFDKNERYDENSEWRKIVKFFTQKDGKYPKDFKIRDHEILSVIHTVAFLKGDEWDKKIRTAILLHHYNKFFVEREQHITRILQDYPQIKEYLSLVVEKRNVFDKLSQELFNDLWKTFKNRDNAKFILDAIQELKSNLDVNRFKNLLDSMDIGVGVSNLLPLYALYDKKDDYLYNFFIFLGLLRRCDYAASAGPKVEAEKPVSIVESVVREVPDKIKSKLKISKMWQEEILDKYKKEDNPILIAPTGSGKTEFAILWACEKGKKLLYTLPLRVALNDLFARFSGKEGYFNKEYVDLLHSTAFIEYLEEEKRNKEVSVGAKLKEVKLFASPVLLTTPDQVFLTSLKYYGFDKLLSIYPLSTVVVDEIQAYDPEMAAIIIKSLDMVKSVGGNILVITATFPPYFRKYLTDVGNNSLKMKEIDLKNEKDKITQKIKNYDLKRHRIALVKDTLVESNSGEDKIEKIKEIIEKDENKKKNVLIILNTVMNAIEVYNELIKSGYDKENVYLLHSRLIEKEKSQRIKEIKDKIESSSERIIVVSTQIVEASVDFDFDILLTEISPIDSQVQRWGRIYRNREEEGNYEDGEPNIYIFIGKEDKNAVKIDKSTTAIYKPVEVLRATIDVLGEIEKKNKVLSYEDERGLIENVYSREDIKRIYEEEIEGTLKWLDVYHASKKSEAQRIFRRLAGVQLVIPQIIESYAVNEKEYTNELKNFAKILKSGEQFHSWKEINERIFGASASEKSKLNILRWMYEYSIPIPEYALHGYLQDRYHEFMGFYILNIKDEKVKEIIEFGIDILRNEDLDEWIEEQTNIIG